MKQLILYLIVLFAVSSYTKNSTIKINTNNQPEVPIILGFLKGDRFTATDTLQHNNGKLTFQLPEDVNIGVYRLILGQTSYARVMNKPPQHLDFIFNSEDIEIESNFRNTVTGTKVIMSEENRIWYQYLNKELIWKEKEKELLIDINYFQDNKNNKQYSAGKLNSLITEFNKLQKKQINYIENIKKEYKNSFAAKLISLKQKPFLDGNLTAKERKEILKALYFDNTDFTDETLINSSAYTDKVFSYLMLYAQKTLSKAIQEEEFKKAIDIILNKTSENQNVEVFIVDYLMRGFEKLHQDNLELYIAKNYSPPENCDCINKNSTLKRRLEFQKMKQGTLAPNFTLENIDGKQINLSQISNDYKLLVFWETGCPSCKQLLPRLREWYSNKKIDLEILTISIDEDPNVWRKYVNSNNFPWISLNEAHKWDGKIAMAYNLYATPTMFLLDKDNRIISKPINFEQFLTIDLVYRKNHNN